LPPERLSFTARTLLPLFAPTGGFDEHRSPTSGRGLSRREYFEALKGFHTCVLLDAEGVERFRATGTGFHESRGLGAAIDRQLKRQASGWFSGEGARSRLPVLHP
jgi:hypothetical protein